MNTQDKPIAFMHNPLPESIAATIEGFLHQLGGPTMITVDGIDRSRTRAICTLLHGNEPSGLKAIHRWLRSGGTPCVNIVCFIISVEAALCETLFRHRILPGERDMNRCFSPPFNDYNGRIAAHLLELLEQYQPECLIDIHNTSGMSPAFGVATHEDPAHEALISLFTHHLIITDLTLGALMEVSNGNMPVVTVECGGANDERSDELAVDGLSRYLFQPQVLSPVGHGIQIDLYHHPVRLELVAGASIAFADAPVPDADLTVPQGLEQHNFGVAPTGTFIGWLGERRGVRALRVVSSDGRDLFTDYFRVEANRLCTAQKLKLFMITQRADIALSDCLLYATPEREHTIATT